MFDSQGGVQQGMRLRWVCHVVAPLRHRESTYQGKFRDKCQVDNYQDVGTFSGEVEG